MTGSSYSYFGLNNTYNARSIYAGMFGNSYGSDFICANQGGICNCDGTVTYGNVTNYISKTVHGSIMCNTDAF
jgi:hypothetical protein